MSDTKSYPVLTTSRGEMLQMTEERPDLFWDITAQEMAERVRTATDQDLEWIARKAGDYLIEGGDYYEAIAAAMEGCFG